MTNNTEMKFYAVVVGRCPGIYTDWKTVESMIYDYPGAIFKTFTSQNNAQEFMYKNTTKRKQITEGTKILPIIDKIIIYTAGSYYNNISGFGVVIINATGDKITAYGKVP